MRAGWARAVLLVALAVAPRVAFAEDPVPAPPPKVETPAPLMLMSSFDATAQKCPGRLSDAPRSRPRRSTGASIRCRRYYWSLNCC